MNMREKQIADIHESLVNGQRKQMVEQIDDYNGGLYDFWHDYRDYLTGLYVEIKSGYDYFADACISYHRIKTR